MKEELMGKCGFYCGSCPTYRKHHCKGCIEEHYTGDCFTRDCVLSKDISYCGECSNFPCKTIIEKPHTTVLDKDWLLWKRKDNPLI